MERYMMPLLAVHSTQGSTPLCAPPVSQHLFRSLCMTLAHVPWKHFANVEGLFSDLGATCFGPRQKSLSRPSSVNASSQTSCLGRVHSIFRHEISWSVGLLACNHFSIQKAVSAWRSCFC